MSYMNEMRLEFVCSGIQKCGTTTLHEWLLNTDGIVLPHTKEAPYFSTDNFTTKGVGEYFRLNFPNERGVVGKCTPQYMMYTRSAERLAVHNKQMKIIVILRNPIERLISHYKMNVRRGEETRSIDTAVNECVRGCVSEYDPEREQIVRFGEYGRILNEYLRWFPASQIKIIDFEALESDPFGVYCDVIDFIGVARPAKAPQSVGKRYHVGSTKSKFIASKELVKNPVFLLFKKIMPTKLRRRLRQAYDFWNISNDGDDVVISAESRQLLVEHYKKDIRDCRSILEDRIDVRKWFA